MDKHRSDSVGKELRFTLLDDYLHVVDTALWLAGDKTRVDGGVLQTTSQGNALRRASLQRGATARSPPACIVARKLSA